MDYVGPVPGHPELGNEWYFLEESRKYLHADCVALHQIILKFFTVLNEEFKLNPITNLSIPGVAFKAWKQVQLPLLNATQLQVYDLGKSLDPIFREAYHGGTVEVYRPHLKGGGYYYDVNSLYPTAMCRPMPVGIPTQVNLTGGQFSGFFGYLQAKVQAPANLYVGLLPIKHSGKLICPGGTFEGFLLIPCPVPATRILGPY